MKVAAPAVKNLASPRPDWYFILSPLFPFSLLPSLPQDDYLLIDCPGQIELYSHIPVFKKVAHMLQARGFNVSGVDCIDPPLPVTLSCRQNPLFPPCS